MPALGDVIELVHEQTYLGQQLNNVYFFQYTDVANTMQDLATWYEVNVVPSVKAIQNDLVTHVNLRLRNLFDADETLEEPLTGTGSVASGMIELPSFMAFQIRLEHPTKTIRSGFKRYSGITEGMIIDGLVDPAQITSLGNLADRLINPPSNPNPGWSHVIVQRVCETPNPDPTAIPSCLKYRLPETIAEANLAYPDTYSIYTQPTTQNSRKWYT